MRRGDISKCPAKSTGGNYWIRICYHRAMTYLIKELLVNDSTSPFGDWFAELDSLAAAKVRVAVARMEQGNLSNVQWFRGIGEFRIDWGPGFRIYLAKDGLRIILLLGGGTKKSQQKDIEQAVEHWENHKRRKAHQG